MPELPEVETVAAALRSRLLGRRVRKVEIHAPRLRRPLKTAHHAPIIGRRIVAVRRRAKYLIVEFDNLYVLTLHLGMSGSCRICPAGLPRRKHEHVIWHLDDGRTWRFEDPRRFGLVEVEPVEAAGALPRRLRALPPEPLERDFSAEYLRAACVGRARAIKLALMDQAIVAGLGNIYAAEALFRAGLRPTRRSCDLTRAERVRLVRAIRAVLREAIAAGGTTISDFKTVDGSAGRFAANLRVYGRAGERCRRCRADRIIRRIVMGGRSTYYCPRCQG